MGDKASGDGCTAEAINDHYHADLTQNQPFPLRTRLSPVQGMETLYTKQLLLFFLHLLTSMRCVYTCRDQVNAQCLECEEMIASLR